MATPDNAQSWNYQGPLSDQDVWNRNFKIRQQQLPETIAATYGAVSPAAGRATNGGVQATAQAGAKQSSNGKEEDEDWWTE